jgi:hypothetical protein
MSHDPKTSQKCLKLSRKTCLKYPARFYLQCEVADFTHIPKSVHIISIISRVSNLGQRSAGALLPPTSTARVGWPLSQAPLGPSFRNGSIDASFPFPFDFFRPLEEVE